MDTELLETMIRWEQGELNRLETHTLFQILLDSRLIWRLHNSYGRKMMELLDAGHCVVTTQLVS